jgi:hypothetical protein
MSAASGVQSADGCEFDITQCVPDQLLLYQGVLPKECGPNCWNMALVFSHILPNLRYSTPEEMSFYMQPPLCRALKKGEQKYPGDVGAIRTISNGKDFEEHGFIYVNDALSYSKNGFTNTAAYSLQPAEQIYSLYGVSAGPDCRDGEPAAAAHCANFVSYFRCISLESYLNHHKKIPQDFLTALKTVDNYESCVQGRMIMGTPLTSTATIGLNAALEGLAKFAKQEREKTGLPSSFHKEEDFLLNDLELRLNALTEDFKIISDSNREVESSNFDTLIKKSLTELDSSVVTTQKKVSP